MTAAPTPPAEGVPATAGPYLRQGRTVYVLHEAEVRRHAYGRTRLEMVNRWSALVQPHEGCPVREAEAVAQLFAAAPDMAAALQDLTAFVGMIYGDTDDVANALLARADAALALARPIATRRT